jgi:hypothetical protein
MNASKKASLEPKGCSLDDAIYFLWNTCPASGLDSSSDHSPFLSLIMVNIHHFANPVKIALIPNLIQNPMN